MKDNKLLLALFAAIIITSGCVENSDDESSTPVSVNDFSITPNPVPGGQTVNVRMELENAGDQEITGTYATLFGPTFATEETQQKTWRTSDGGGVNSEYRTMEFDTLPPATDTSPAVPRRDSVTFMSPSLEEGRINSRNFKARIQYKTSTSANTEIQVMSNERQQEVGASESKLVVENSDGPVQVEAQGTTPHVFYDVGTADEEICFTLRNGADGTPFLVTGDKGASETASGYDIDSESQDKVRLTVEDVGNVKFESQETGGNSANVEIIGNEGYHCYDMELTGLGQITDLEQSTTIPINVDYGYQEETSTSVTVEGRRQTDVTTETNTNEDNNNNNEDDIGSPGLE